MDRLPFGDVTEKKTTFSVPFKMKSIVKICALFLPILFTIKCATTESTGRWNDILWKLCLLVSFFSALIYNPLTIDTLAEKIANGGAATVVTEGKDALLTCVIMGAYSNDTVLWRRSNNEIVAAGTNRVISDRRFSVLHDDCKLRNISFMQNIANSWKERLFCNFNSAKNERCITKWRRCLGTRHIRCTAKR